MHANMHFAVENMHFASRHCGEHASQYSGEHVHCTPHRGTVAVHASCTWNYGRGAAGEVMRAHLL